jgi:hypothetical protein
MTDFHEVWDLSEPDPQDERLKQTLKQLISGSSPEDSKLNRQLQKDDSDHKKAMEKARAEFERTIELHRVKHDRWTNYSILAIVSLLFLVSVVVLSVIGYQEKNDHTLRDKAISLLAPLTGLALGFLSGKIKWPAL